MHKYGEDKKATRVERELHEFLKSIGLSHLEDTLRTLNMNIDTLGRLTSDELAAIIPNFIEQEKIR